MNRWRNFGIWVAIIALLGMVICLASLPIIEYIYGHWYSSETRIVWVWGWADSGFTYWKWLWEIPPYSSYMESSGDSSFCTDCFYPSAIAVFVFGLLSLLIYLGITLSLIQQPNKSRVATVRLTTAWTWVWALSLTNASSWAASTEINRGTYRTLVAGDPSLNAWIALGVAVLLSAICWVVHPTQGERNELQTRLNWIKGETAQFFTRSGLPATTSEINTIINHAREAGARKQRINASIYAEFLPKLWSVYSLFSNQAPIDIGLLGSQLGMLECDSSKFTIGLARAFNLTMNAGILMPRPDIDMNQLMKTSEELLRSWREEVKRREADHY